MKRPYERCLREIAVASQARYSTNQPEQCRGAFRMEREGVLNRPLLREIRGEADGGAAYIREFIKLWLLIISVNIK